MRRQYRDYFVYALDAVKDISDDGMLTDCDFDNECLDSGKKETCCVHTELFHPETDTKDIHYRCMTKKIVNANGNFNLGNMHVKMRCVGSSAVYMALSVATAVAASATLI